VYEMGHELLFVSISMSIYLSTHAHTQTHTHTHTNTHIEHTQRHAAYDNRVIVKVNGVEGDYCTDTSNCGPVLHLES